MFNIKISDKNDIKTLSKLLNQKAYNNYRFLEESVYYDLAIGFLENQDITIEEFNNFFSLEVYNLIPDAFRD